MEDLGAIKDIPMYKDWVKIEPVLKGFSEDKKFFIEMEISFYLNFLSIQVMRISLKSLIS